MKTMVIINPASKRGRSKGLSDRIRQRLSRLDPVTVTTRYTGHATLLTAQAIQAGYSRIIAVGGDGTVNEILNGMVGSAAVIGIVPTGTANDVAAHYGIPDDIDAACDVILNGDIRRPDVISVNDWYFLTVGGIGLPCDTLASAESIKRRDRLGRLLAFSLGSRIYLLALLLTLMKRRWGRMNLTVTTDRLRHSGPALSLIIGNQARLGKHFNPLPRARNNDGLLDVFVLRDSRRPLQSLMTVGSAVKGNHEGRPDVEMLRVDRLEVESHHAVPFFGDGQIGTTGKSFLIRVVPSAVNLITPVSCEDN